MNSIRSAIVTGIILFFCISSILADAPSTGDNVTEANNKTDTTGGTGDGTGKNAKESDSSFSSELKFCLIIAAVLTVVAGIACLIIKKKGDSGGYASGGNIPKPLAGMSDDF